MNMTENTILITGGGSGIGRGLAEAFHSAGNQVIIAGRRQSALDEVTTAKLGIRSMVLDIDDANAIQAFAEKIVMQFPKLNVVVNNAGMMKPENFKDAPAYLKTAEATITTNLLGPIRLTAALLPHLLKQKSAAIMATTSGLAFVPYPIGPSYSATKAALHSYLTVLRHQLKDTSVNVFEIAPPYVQTELGGKRQASDPRAMPLNDYIAEVMTIFKSPPSTGEILVERVKPMRYAERDGTIDQIFSEMAKMSM